MSFVQHLTRRQYWFMLLLLVASFAYWSENRSSLLQVFAQNPLAFYYISQYGLVILTFYWLSKNDPNRLRKTVAFAILLTVTWDLVIGLPFVYGKNGLGGQQLGEGTRLSDDAILGVAIEERLYGCTSDEHHSIQALPLSPCTPNQTLMVYRIITLGIPALSLIIVSELLHYRSALSLMRKSL